MNEYSEQAQKVSDAEISLWIAVDKAFKELDVRIPPTVEKAFADLGHQQDHLWQMLMMQEVETKRKEKKGRVQTMSEVECMAKRQVLPENRLEQIEADLSELKTLTGGYTGSSRPVWTDEDMADLRWLLDQNRALRTALERLARLGNEPFEGNSDGNRIARAALDKLAATPCDEPPCEEVEMGSLETVSTSREDTIVTQHVFGIDGTEPSDLATLFRTVADWIDDSDDEVVDVTLGGDAGCTQLYVYCEE